MGGRVAGAVSAARDNHVAQFLGNAGSGDSPDAPSHVLEECFHVGRSASHLQLWVRSVELGCLAEGSYGESGPRKREGGCVNEAGAGGQSTRGAPLPQKSAAKLSQSFDSLGKGGH